MKNDDTINFSSESKTRFFEKSLEISVEQLA
jgi:hypothetical protein